MRWSAVFFPKGDTHTFHWTGVMLIPSGSWSSSCHSANRGNAMGNMCEMSFHDLRMTCNIEIWNECCYCPWNSQSPDCPNDWRLWAKLMLEKTFYIWTISETGSLSMRIEFWNLAQYYSSDEASISCLDCFLRNVHLFLHISDWFLFSTLLFGFQ